MRRRTWPSIRITRRAWPVPFVRDWRRRRLTARGALIALADQVAVTADDLRQLVSRWEQQPDRIVAALYDDTIGVPAIFPADLFAGAGGIAGRPRRARTAVALSGPSDRRAHAIRGAGHRHTGGPPCQHAVVICTRAARQLFRAAVTIIQSNATGVVSAERRVAERRHPGAQCLLHAAIAGLRSGVADSSIRLHVEVRAVHRSRRRLAPSRHGEFRSTEQLQFRGRRGGDDARSNAGGYAATGPAT